MLNITDLRGMAKQFAEKLIAGYEVGLTYVQGDDSAPATTLLYNQEDPDPFEVYATLYERNAYGDIVLKISRRAQPDGYLLITNDDITSPEPLSKYANFILDDRVLLDDGEEWDYPSSIFMFFRPMDYVRLRQSLGYHPSDVAIIIPVDISDRREQVSEEL